MKKLTLITICAILCACTSQIPKPLVGAKADFTYTSDGKYASFKNASTTGLSAYCWYFGDNTYVEKKETVSHTYKANGNYNVTLQCKDANGYLYECSKAITISNGSSQGGGGTDTQEDASAYFEYELLSDYHSLNIKDGSKGKRAVYDFGDGTSPKEITLPYDYLIFHNYTKNGTYTIKCTAYGSNGDSKTYTQSITIRDPKIYITGIKYISVDYPGEYYKAVLKDDDIFTTTWFTTYYTYPEEFPYTYNFQSPIEMSGLDEDDYYTLYVYHNKSFNGDGTQCLKQNIYTITFKAYLPYVEVKNNSGNTIVHLLMEYK